MTHSLSGRTKREVWWLSINTPDRSPKVPGSNPAYAKPRAHCCHLQAGCRREYYTSEVIEEEKEEKKIRGPQ